MSCRRHVRLMLVREWDRRMILTLSDDSIWRYYNGSDFWECLAGALKERWARRPGRADHAPLTDRDNELIGQVRLYASAPGARPQTPHPKRLP